MNPFQPTPSGTITQPIPAEFKPVFQEKVMFTGSGLPNNYPINPESCLTMASAKELIAIPEIAALNPMIFLRGPLGSGFHGVFLGMEDLAGVPWLAFPTGVVVNAGSDFAAWFTRFNYRTAVYWCLVDYQSGLSEIAAQAALPPPMQQTT